MAAVEKMSNMRSRLRKAIYSIWMATNKMGETKLMMTRATRVTQLIRMRVVRARDSGPFVNLTDSNVQWQGTGRGL